LAGITVLMVVRTITIGLGMSAGSRAQKQSLGDLMDWVGPGPWSLVLLVLVLLIAILGMGRWQQFAKAVAPAICKICAR
jgi:hypothetical protein